jgi:EF hand domain-containing protein
VRSEPSPSTASSLRERHRRRPRGVPASGHRRILLSDKEHKGYLTASQLPEASPEAFKAATVKGDGRLSLPEEVNALLKDFDAADVNRDGTLTYEEFETYVKRSSY